MNILIYGNERYLLVQKLNQVITTLVGVSDAMNTSYYDASTPGFSMLPVLEDADTLALFSEKKVVVVNNALFLTKGNALDKQSHESLLSYLKQADHQSTMIFVHDNDNLDTSKDIVKALMQNAEIHRVKKLETSEFRSFVLDLVHKSKLKMTPAAFEEFLFRLDENMSTAHHEIEKLIIYNEPVDLEEVEALVSRPLDNEVFHLVNALLDKNMKRAFSIWNDMMVLNMEPLSFVGLIASQLRLMYQVSLLNKEGYHREDMINLLSAGTPTINVSRVNRMLNLSRKTKPERILQILNRLAELDQKSKVGLLDKRFGFELFLIEAMS